MKVAHFDCFSGISGDMTLGALIDAGVDSLAIRDGIASLGLPVTLRIAKVRKGGFAATAVTVEAPEEDAVRFLPDVEEILERGALTPAQRDLARRIFRRLAEAESRAHGLPLDRVHFHEVGALDSIADIVGSAIGLDLLGVERFTSRPVPPGRGMVKCAHGLMPVPAPGTAELLKGVPLAASAVEAELTTPTGAAILTTVVGEWRESPVMTVERIGHGAGRKDFPEQPNLLRLLVGTAPAPTPAAVPGSSRDVAGYETDEVWVVETNLDDLPGEVVGYCYDRLFGAGAVDVYTTPIFMKKNRPAVLLTVLAPPAALADVEEVLFRETGTLGVRRSRAERHKLHREAATAPTPWGEVRGKLAWREGHPPAFSPEYDDCARVAREYGIPLRVVHEAAARAFADRQTPAAGPG